MLTATAVAASGLTQGVRAEQQQARAMPVHRPGCSMFWRHTLNMCTVQRQAKLKPLAAHWLL